MPGGTEWIVILVVGLLIFGRRLPEVGKSLGRSIVEFKKGVKGIESEVVFKQHEGRPNIVDGIKNGEIGLVINTPSGKMSQHDDSYIRKTAITYKVPYITTLAAASAAAKGIEEYRGDKVIVRSLQEYHGMIE